MRAQDLNTADEAAMCLTLRDAQFGAPKKTTMQEQRDGGSVSM